MTDWMNICHSLSSRKERCLRPDGHEGRHIGMRSGWTEEHPESPTLPKTQPENVREAIKNATSQPPSQPESEEQ